MNEAQADSADERSMALVLAMPLSSGNRTYYYSFCIAIETLLLGI